jgi:hypothetical protein
MTMSTPELLAPTTMTRLLAKDGPPWGIEMVDDSIHKQNGTITVYRASAICRIDNKGWHLVE